MIPPATLRTISGHLEALDLPLIVKVLAPGDAAIPDKAREKHPDKHLLLFATPLEDSKSRNELQKRLPDMVIGRDGIYVRVNGEAERVENGKTAAPPDKSEATELHTKAVQDDEPVTTSGKQIIAEVDYIWKVLTRDNEINDWTAKGYVPVEFAPCVENGVVKCFAVFMREVPTGPAPQPEQKAESTPPVEEKDAEAEKPKPTITPVGSAVTIQVAEPEIVAVPEAAPVTLTQAVHQFGAQTVIGMMNARVAQQVETARRAYVQRPRPAINFGEGVLT